jgi:hypothetical protein
MSNYESLGNLLLLLQLLGIKSEIKMRSKYFDPMHVVFGFRDAEKARAGRLYGKEFQGWLKLKIEAGLGHVEIEETSEQGNPIKRKLGMEEV